MKAVYPPFFLQVSRAAQQAWLKHIEVAGYTLTHTASYPGTPEGAENWVAKLLPLYGSNCIVAKSDPIWGSKRKTHWILIRLPDTAKARRRRHPSAKKQKAKPCPKR